LVPGNASTITSDPTSGDDALRRLRRAVVAISLLSILAIALLLFTTMSNQWYIAPEQESAWTEDEISQTLHLGLREGEVHFQFAQGGSDERVLGFVYSDSEDLAGTDFTDAAMTTLRVLIAGLVILGASLVVLAVHGFLAPSQGGRSLRWAPAVTELVALALLGGGLLYFATAGISALRDDHRDEIDWSASGFGMAFWLSVAALVLVAISVVLMYVMIAGPGARDHGSPGP